MNVKELHQRQIEWALSLAKAREALEVPRTRRNPRPDEWERRRVAAQVHAARAWGVEAFEVPAMMPIRVSLAVDGVYPTDDDPNFSMANRHRNLSYLALASCSLNAAWHWMSVAGSEDLYSLRRHSAETAQMLAFYERVDALRRAEALAAARKAVP